MYSRMAVQQRQKRSGNTYNLRNRVEIAIKIQVSDKGALLNNFSVPTSDQVLPSSDTVSTRSSIDVKAIFLKHSSDSDVDTNVNRLDFRKSERTP